MTTVILGVGIPSARKKETGKIIDAVINFANTPQSAGDVLEIAIPANTSVDSVYYSVNAACTDGSTRTLGIGDSGSATKWASAVDMTSAATGIVTAGQPTVYPLTASTTATTLYAAANILALTLNQNMASGSIRIVAYGKIIG